MESKEAIAIIREMIQQRCQQDREFEALSVALDALTNAEEKLVGSSIWHKESEHPANRHPYPVYNPTTQEMAFGYYDRLCGWQFDRDYPRSTKMLWLDIEKIIPANIL